MPIWAQQKDENIVLWQRRKRYLIQLFPIYDNYENITWNLVTQFGQCYPTPSKVRRPLGLFYEPIFRESTNQIFISKATFFTSSSISEICIRVNTDLQFFKPVNFLKIMLFTDFEKYCLKFFLL